jgi:hypothetical protein
LVEALGGWFLFGSANSARQIARLVGDVVGTDAVPVDAAGGFLRGGEDTAAVIALLKDPRFHFDLLTGHSKGNLVLSEALYALVESDEPLPLAVDTRIITISAVIAMPREFTDIVDVMGAWDMFGRMNSRASIPIDVSVPTAGHHTNREVPYHLPVTETLSRVLNG